MEALKKIGSLLLIIGVGIGGWALGSVYPAPQAWLEQFTPHVIDQRVRDLSGRVLKAAESDGHVVPVERVEKGAVAEEPEVATAPIPLRGGYETELFLCPGMAVSNAPKADKTRKVLNYAPVVTVKGVMLMVNPTHGACLSSGFGSRSGRLHKGVDYHSKTGGPIMAAASGVVIEKKYRDDYGNMILIDHGNGVYTRYAHLSAFQNGIAVGKRVRIGDLIGLMGNTASYPIPIHLHFELLQGDYAGPKASFGLTPSNPYSYPASKG